MTGNRTQAIPDVRGLAAGNIAMAQPAVDWESVTEDRLLNPDDGDWMSYRRTYDVTGFSTLDVTNRSNVSDLRLVWAYSMYDVTGWVPTPIVANGLMYVSESSGRVTVFDVVSGDVVWVHTRSLPRGHRALAGLHAAPGRVGLQRHDLLGHGRCGAGRPGRPDGRVALGGEHGRLRDRLAVRSADAPWGRAGPALGVCRHQLVQALGVQRQPGTPNSTRPVPSPVHAG